MIELLKMLPAGSFAYAMILAMTAIVGKVVLQWLKNTSAEKLAKLANSEALEKHVQHTSIMLLEELRKDLSRISSDNNSLEANKLVLQGDLLIWVSRARALIRYLENILTATTPEEKLKAEEAARSFLDTLPSNI